MKPIVGKNTFSKAERLCSRKLIGELVDKGKSITLSPIRITWLYATLDGTFPVQVLMAVPKRNFKKAVDRNIIRRRMREAYRKNKSLLYPFLLQKEKQIALMLVYLGKEILSYAELEKAMVLSLNRLGKEIEKQQNK